MHSPLSCLWVWMLHTAETTYFRGVIWRTYYPDHSWKESRGAGNIQLTACSLNALITIIDLRLTQRLILLWINTLSIPAVQLPQVSYCRAFWLEAGCISKLLSGQTSPNCTCVKCTQLDALLLSCQSSCLRLCFCLYSVSESFALFEFSIVLFLFFAFFLILQFSACRGLVTVDIVTTVIAIRYSWLALFLSVTSWHDICIAECRWQPCTQSYTAVQRKHVLKVA